MSAETHKIGGVARLVPFFSTTFCLSSSFEKKQCILKQSRETNTIPMGYLGKAGSSSILHTPSRQRRRDVWDSHFMRKNASEKRLIIQSPWIYSVASMNLAAVEIQRIVRGYIGRATGFAPLRSVTAGEKGRRWCDLGLKEKSNVYVINPLYHVASMQIQVAWRASKQRRYANMVKLTQKRKQRRQSSIFWRSRTNKRIYVYYKDLINFRACGDPTQLLEMHQPERSCTHRAIDGCVRALPPRWRKVSSIYIL